MNIVIPAAGMGSRFVTAGYTVPKPFLPIKGKPMVEWVIDNFWTHQCKVYVLMRTQDMTYLQGSSLAYKDGICFIPVDRPTEGAACTVLTARPFIDNDEPLLLVNSDQWVRYDHADWKRCLENQRYDAMIMTFPNDDPKWSYAEVDVKADARVVRVAEKEVISNQATCGIYWFRKGSYFCEGADLMIDKNIRVRGEFYVCPIFNEIVGTKNVFIFGVDEMFGLGTPEDFQANAGAVGA